MKKYILPCILTLCFIVFTILVKVIDVQALGPEDSLIGFATVNTAFHNLFSDFKFFYILTQILGVAALALAATFAVTGLVQLVKRRSLLKVDRCIIALGVTYIVVIALYVLFEKLAINYRPVITEEGLEASYPSTHTMLILCVFGTARYALYRLIKNPKTAYTLNIFCLIIMSLTVVGRLICGVHWLTDIVGSLLISSAIVSAYSKSI